MFCESCGQEVENDDKFCPYCGKPIVTGQDTTIYLGNDEKSQEDKEMPDIQERDQVYDKAQFEIPNQEGASVVPMQRKWPGRLLTGMLLTAVLVLAVNIAVGLIYLHQMESQDDNYVLPELNITEPDESNI